MSAGPGKSLPLRNGETKRPSLPEEQSSCRIRAIVFDFDGTLARLNIDFTRMRAAVAELIASSAIATDGLGKLHILEMIEEAKARIAAIDRQRARAFFLAAHAAITAVEMEAAVNGSLFAGTEELLTELAQRGMRTGVVTRNCRAAVIRTFPAIDRHCHAVLTRDDVERVKPHPAHLQAALRVLGVDAPEAAMVGDHPLDICLGRDTGVFSVGVLSGHSSREALAAAGADLILPDVTHLRHALP